MAESGIAEAKAAQAISTATQSGESAWQDKLLPLMRGMLISLTAFFIVATLYQAYNIQQRIVESGREEYRLPSEATGTDADAWRARVGLEAYAIRHRYQHSSLILMSRAWIIYLGFVTGMILAMVGATFILGKIQESESQLTAKGGAGEFSFKSASPGLMMAVLGVALMICTMSIRADVTVTDTPLYFLPEVRVSGRAATPTEPGEISGQGKPVGGNVDDSVLNALHDKGK